MRKTLMAVAVPLCLVSHAAAGQSGIPVTVAQAEADGAAYSRSDTANGQHAVFSQYVGKSDRRCVAADAADDQHTGWLSLRSGEMIVRGTWYDSVVVRAGKANKYVWFPLHGSGDMKAPLVIRADRVGAPADSLRLSVAHLARGGGYEYGYPSSVAFPTPGRWLVVTTAGSDWGCFVLDVGKSVASRG